MGTPKPLSQSKRVRSQKNHRKRIKECQFLWVLSILLFVNTLLIAISSSKTDPSKIEKSYHDLTIDKGTVTSITLTPGEVILLKMTLVVNDIGGGKAEVTVGLRKLLGGLEDVSNDGKTNRKNGEKQQIIVPGTNSDTSDLYYSQQLYLKNLQYMH
uniref:Uncharacterized protein n=1 Tax=Anguilla anguilla TaxID=7936 RepID=A0A0E9XVK2_ANGAN